MDNFKTSTILHETKPEELIKALRTAFKEELEDFKKNIPERPAEYLSKRETAKMLGITLSTLDRWTMQGLIKRHSIGNRIYYLRSNVEAAITEL